jgi:hypothetical protein
VRSRIDAVVGWGVNERGQPSGAWVLGKFHGRDTVYVILPDLLLPDKLAFQLILTSTS